VQSKILVVDDTPHNVKLLADLLTAKNYEVQTAAAGPEALELLPGFMPDIVLLDVMMPGMSGYEVCEKIRENEATRLQGCSP
jgi:CheY-like chemotaxis protein